MMDIGGIGGVVRVQSGVIPDAKRQKGGVPSNRGPYDVALTLYTLPPVGDVSPDEFESFAQDRLVFLKKLEAQLSKNRAAAKENWKSYGPPELPDKNDMNDLERARGMIRRDVISHYVLKLAYRHPDKQDWLVNMEAELLKLRLEGESVFRDFLMNTGFHFLERPASEVPSEVRRFHSGNGQAEPSKYFEADWEEVLDLVAIKQVILIGGVAYLKYSDLKNLVVNRFKIQMKKSMDLANRTFGHSRSAVGRFDDMVKDFLDRLPSQYLGKELGSTQYGDSPVELSQLDDLARDHFPLCMRVAHNHVRREHHMRHMGRLQYGLFLKGIGLTLEQSMDFWKREFTIRVGEEGWKKKQYEYNIKYNYGKVGRRVNAAPYSCSKIVALPSERGDAHGCPFRTMTREDLSLHIGDATSDVRVKREILKMVEDRSYTEACITYYRAKRGAASGERLESHALHPNLYYIQSRTDEDRLRKGEDLGTVAFVTRPDAANTSVNQSQMDLDASSSYYDDMLFDQDPDALATQALLSRSITSNQAAMEVTAPEASQTSNGAPTSQQLLDELAPLASQE